MKESIMPILKEFPLTFTSSSLNLISYWQREKLKSQDNIWKNHENPL